MRLYYDFHIHSCLSPCGEAEMTPQNIANMAALAGFNSIAVADHNTTANAAAVAACAARAGISAVPAMELCTREEVHVLCLLPDIIAAEEFGRYVYDRLPDIPNRSDIFGRQLVMDAEDKIVREEERLLISAVDIGIYDVAGLMEDFGGVAVPAHLDRDSFSVISNLGFLDPAMGFSAVEITGRCAYGPFTETHPELKGMACLVSSDAHALAAIPDPARFLEVPGRAPAQIIEAIRSGIF